MGDYGPNLACAISSHYIQEGKNGRVEFNVPNNENHHLMFGLTSRKEYNTIGTEYVFEKHDDRMLYTKLNRGKSTRVSGVFFTDKNDKIVFEKVNKEIRGYLNGVLVHTFKLYKDHDLRIILKFGQKETEAEIPTPVFCSDVQALKEYFPLAKKMSEKVWRFKGKEMKFIFNEPYGIQDNSILNATLYNYKNEVVATSSELDIRVNQGINKITIDCFQDILKRPSGDDGLNKVYYLHIKNSKEEDSYLQFLLPLEKESCEIIKKIDPDIDHVIKILVK